MDRVQRLITKPKVFVALALLTACGEEPPPPEPVVRPVRYQAVYSTGGEIERSFSGTARAAQESKLSFKIRGTASRVPVQVGDKVRRGQLIASLDDKDYQLRVQDADASLASARAQAEQAESNFERVRKLYENDNTSVNDYAAAKAGATSAKEAARSAQKRLELANSELSYARLLAPTDGDIASVQIEENENIQPGQTVVLLTSGSELEVELAIPEKLIGGVREGDAVTIQFDALPDRQHSGRVTEVGVAAIGRASIFPVTARLDQADEACRPGMAAQVALVFGGDGGRKHLYIPFVSVGSDREGQYVYVLAAAEEGFGSVKRRAVQVKTSPPEGENFEIIEGLEDGELVVTAGVSRIRDGQRVRMLGAE